MLFQPGRLCRVYLCVPPSHAWHLPLHKILSRRVIPLQIPLPSFFFTTPPLLFFLSPLQASLNADDDSVTFLVSELCIRKFSPSFFLDIWSSKCLEPTTWDWFFVIAGFVISGKTIETKSLSFPFESVLHDFQRNLITHHLLSNNFFYVVHLCSESLLEYSPKKCCVRVRGDCCNWRKIPIYSCQLWLQLWFSLDKHNRVCGSTLCCTSALVSFTLPN